jgi:hypothetical protein
VAAPLALTVTTEESLKWSVLVSVRAWLPRPLKAPPP